MAGDAHHRSIIEGGMIERSDVDGGVTQTMVDDGDDGCELRVAEQAELGVGWTRGGAVAHVPLQAHDQHLICMRSVFAARLAAAAACLLARDRKEPLERRRDEGSTRNERCCATRLQSTARARENHCTFRGKRKKILAILSKCSNTPMPSHARDQEIYRISVWSLVDYA